jgi:DNA-binding LacI/PurR family transcriptional regulator
MGSRRTTMGDVAARAGVSRQLVSLVFRNAPGASAETRRRVRRAADELGYRPDTAARMLRRRSSQHIGVLFRPKHAPEADVIDGIYPAAAQCGYEVVLSALTDARDESTAVEELLGYRCEALILIGSHLPPDELRRLASRVPVVSVGGGVEVEITGADVVRSAGDLGVGLAVDHLFELGHRRIAYVHGQKMPSARIRQEGYLLAMARLGLPAHVVVTPEDYIEESGADAGRILLAEEKLPTAVVAGNDHAALGLIHTFLREGVTVPGHVSVTGFDDSRIAQLSYVDLTSVHQEGAEMGRAAVEAAVARITGARVGPREFVTAPTLAVRGSTAPPPANEVKRPHD